MQKFFTTSDNVRINYDIRSHPGDYLIFLHGVGGDLNGWHAEQQYFHHHKVPTLAIDLRGHGLSDRPADESQYSLERFAKDIQEIIDAEKINNFTLIGHCLGSMVSLMYHQLQPNNAKSYILIDATAKAPAPIAFLSHHPYLIHFTNQLIKNDQAAQHFSHVPINAYRHTGDWYLPRIYSDIQHTTLRSWLNTYQAIGEFDAQKILPTIKQPTLVIHGKNDTIFSPHVGESVHEQIPQSEFILVPHANHILVTNNPHEIETIIEKFLKLK